MTIYSKPLSFENQSPPQPSTSGTMTGRRLRTRKDLTAASALLPSNATTRPRRNTATRSSGTTTIERASPEVGRESVKLTIKAPPSKLAEATSGSKGRAGSIKVNSRDTFEGGEIVTGSRPRKKAIVEESSSEEDEPDPEADYEEEEEEAEHDDMEEDEEEPEEEEEIDEDEDAEGEEDEDIVMEDAPPPPPPKQKPAPVLPKVTITKASQSKLPPARDIVEEKEMAMDDDDEELSELSEEDEELAGEEDAEGEEIGQDDEGDEDEDEEDEDSEMTPATSRGMTPDLSKLTRRQRAAYEEYDGGLMALSNEAQKKKHLTAEEYAARRAEMARRRKNLSEKRNEEEKMDTINRLLKKQAPKRRRRVDMSEALGEGNEEGEEYEKPSAVYTRYVQTTEGVRVAVPEEWLSDHPLGRVFANPIKAEAPRKWSRRMVEEVA